MNDPSKVSMDFFQDFRGTVDEFRTLLALLEIGQAPRDKYGVTAADCPDGWTQEAIDEQNLKKQRDLYEAICTGITAIHPTARRHSLSNADLGEWLFINSRYYRMARANDAQPTYWDEWEVEEH